MEWDEAKQDQDLLSFFKGMIQLRNSHAALRTGGLKFLQDQHNDYVLAYERRDAQDRFVIVMNNSERAVTSQTVVSGSYWHNIVTGQSVRTDKGQLNVELPAYGYMILKATQA